jgi:hypothetical protein
VKDDGTVAFGVFPKAPDSIPPEDSLYFRPLINNSPDIWPAIQRIIVSATTVNDGKWHLITGRLSPSGQYIYIDGEEAASRPDVHSGAYFTGHWRIGHGPLGDWVGRPSDYNFQVSLDEARVSHAERSAGWIKLCYENQKEGSTIVSIE